MVTAPNDGGNYQEGIYHDGLIGRRFWIAIPDQLSYFTADSLRAVASVAGWSKMVILGSFPIDLYLAHPASSYVQNRELGAVAYSARLRLKALVGAHGNNAAN